MLPENLVAAQQLNKDLDELFNSRNKNFGSFERFLKILNGLRDDFESGENVDDDKMDKKMKLVLTSIITSKLSSYLNKCYIRFLEGYAHKLSVQERIHLTKLLLFVANRITEEFCFIGREAIILDEQNDNNFCLSFFHLFMLVSISSNELHQQEEVTTSMEEMLIQINRDAPTSNTSLLLAFSRHSSNYNLFVTPIAKTKMSILTEFAQITQSCKDIPTQINTIDVIFRIVLIMKSKKSKGSISKADLFTYQATFLRSIGLTVKVDELKKVYKEQKSSKEKVEKIIKPISIFTSKSNAEYKKYIRILLEELNKDKRIYSLKIDGVTLSGAPSTVKPALVQGGSNSFDAYIDLNASNLSFYADNNALVSLPYTKIISVFTNSNMVKLQLQSLQAESFGDWIEAGVSSSDISEICFSIKLTRAKELNDLLRTKSNIATKIVEKDLSPNADETKNHRPSIRMSTSTVAITCTKPNKTANSGSAYNTPTRIDATQCITPNKTRRPPDSRESLLGKSNRREAEPTVKSLSVKKPSKDNGIKRATLSRNKRVTRSESKRREAPLSKRKTAPREQRQDTTDEESSLAKSELNHAEKDDKSDDIAIGKELHVFGKLEKKSCATNLTTKSVLTNITYGTRVEMVKRQIQKNKARQVRKTTERQKPEPNKLRSSPRLKIDIPEDEDEDEDDDEDGMEEEEPETPQHSKERLMRKTIKELEAICSKRYEELIKKYFDKSNTRNWPKGHKRPKWKKKELIEEILKQDHHSLRSSPVFLNANIVTPVIREENVPLKQILVQAPKKTKNKVSKIKQIQNYEIHTPISLDVEGILDFDCSSTDKSINSSPVKIKIPKHKPRISNIPEKKKMQDAQCDLDSVHTYRTDTSQEQDKLTHQSACSSQKDHTRTSKSAVDDLISCLVPSETQDMAKNKLTPKRVDRLAQKLEKNQFAFVKVFKKTYKKHKAKQMKYIQQYLNTCFKSSKLLQSTLLKRKALFTENLGDTTKRLKICQKDLALLEKNQISTIDTLNSRLSKMIGTIKERHSKIKSISNEAKELMQGEAIDSEDSLTKIRSLVSTKLKQMEKQINQSKKSSTSLRSKLLALEQM